MSPAQEPCLLLSWTESTLSLPGRPPFNDAAHPAAILTGDGPHRTPQRIGDQHHAAGLQGESQAQGSASHRGAG